MCVCWFFLIIANSVENSVDVEFLVIRKIKTVPTKLMSLSIRCCCVWNIVSCVLLSLRMISIEECYLSEWFDGYLRLLFRFIFFNNSIPSSDPLEKRSIANKEKKTLERNPVTLGSFMRTLRWVGSTTHQNNHYRHRMSMIIFYTVSIVYSMRLTKKKTKNNKKDQIRKHHLLNLAINTCINYTSMFRFFNDNH